MVTSSRHGIRRRKPGEADGSWRGADDPFTLGVASGPPGSTLRQLLSAAAEKAMAGKVNDQRNRVHAVRLRDFGTAG